MPDRDAVPVLAAAVNVTVPLPEPFAPAVTVIHALLLVAVQLQPAGAVTVTVVLRRPWQMPSTPVKSCRCTSAPPGSR